MSNKKMTNKEFKEFIKTPRGKATMFFGAYLLFFIFIGIFARTGGTSNVNKKYETGSPLKYSVSSIVSGNYKFNYEIIVDGVTTTYEGSSTKTNASFSKNGNETYYFNGSNYFTNTSGVWLNVSNPYMYYNFINSDSIKSLIDKATYISKTEYENGSEVYNFKISSATINKLFEGTDLDIEEVPNEIMVGVDEENNVNEIKYTLDSYCKVKSSCTMGMRITLKYDSFGSVEEITSPLE